MKFLAIVCALLATQAYGFDSRCKVNQKSPKVNNKACVDYTDVDGNVWDTCVPFDVLSPQNPPDNTAGKQWCATSSEFDISSEDPDVNGLWGVCATTLPKACLYVAPTEAPSPKTKKPSASPTVKTKRPSKSPTNKPTKKATGAPTCGGTGKKSCSPTTAPVDTPTSTPEYEVPSSSPTEYETQPPADSTIVPTLPPVVPSSTPTTPIVTSAPSTPIPTSPGQTFAPTLAPTSAAPTTGVPTPAVTSRSPTPALTALTRSPTPSNGPRVDTKSPTTSGASMNKVATLLFGMMLIALQVAM